MDQQLELLIRLQRLDTDIISSARIIREIPGRIKAAEGPLIKAREAVQRQRKKLDETLARRKSLDQDLTANTDKIKKLKDRIKDLKDNKAYHAHLKEVADNEKVSSSIEDSILDAMQAAEDETRALLELETALKAEEARVASVRQQLDAEVGQAEQAVQQKKSGRPAITSLLTPERYQDYMRLMDIKDGLAVVEAEGEVCSGCNMNIMPQLFVTLKKGNSIIYCPQCSRILYYQAPAG